MRRLFHYLLFVAPIALVAIGFYYRAPIGSYLREKGIIGKPKNAAAFTAPNNTATGERSSTPELQHRAAGPVQDPPPAPKLPSLEELVDNWNNVPRRAYPDRVTLRADAEASLVRDGKVIGKTRVPAGSQVVPLNLEKDGLEIATTASATTRARVPVEETDFKEQIQRTYEAWIARQTALASARLRETVAQTPPSNSGSEPDAGSEPERNPDGSVPIMLESIENAEVTEIDPARITYWRWLGRQTFNGDTYWAGAVGYQTDTMFGIINTEGKALMRDGKVVRWVYSGSEEPIP